MSSELPYRSSNMGDPESRPDENEEEEEDIDETVCFVEYHPLTLPDGLSGLQNCQRCCSFRNRD
jgi:hypothetical protein